MPYYTMLIYINAHKIIKVPTFLGNVPRPISDTNGDGGVAPEFLITLTRD